jgi:hypothetical protein
MNNIDFLQQKAVIGSQEGVVVDEKVDFLFQGLGVQPKHAVLEILNDDERPKLYITLLTENARFAFSSI